eukprot:scaffold991_cov227-Pinguiococcus_pyrenoidosus.AAC.12
MVFSLLWLCHYHLPASEAASPCASEAFGARNHTASPTASRRACLDLLLHLLRSVCLIRGREEHGADQRQGQNTDDDPQADCSRDLVVVEFRHHLRTDEAEHQADGGLEVGEIVDGLRDEHIQGSQGRDGKNVGRVDDEGVLRHPQHGGNRVDREDEVGELNANQAKQQRRRPSNTCGHASSRASRQAKNK